ncbi:MAG: hypothetical protein B7Y89_11235 [Novosphingobium sp. 32-60-15]|nr:DUF5672 family protein [Novosphingobium sp. 32-60-15]OYX62024.1 MAG: hypothetical protein B7Y89_11235 [Novosphingobium sp. 32-60-15]
MPASPPSSRLSLPQVTLCAISSVNMAATLQALAISMEKADFAKCLLLTDVDIGPAPFGVEVVRIAKMTSSAAYSQFLLAHLADYITTSHCLVVQWDGHVINADGWQPHYLDFDYIGASWPQFTDGHNVGNGGFSLRSQRLLRLCQSPRFVPAHPEDLTICRKNRPWLESQGMRFAPDFIADCFSAERAGDVHSTFGYHGVWHMPRVLGHNKFWQIYCGLDDRGTVRHDWSHIVRRMMEGPSGYKRALRIMIDQLRDGFRKGKRS